MIANDPAEIHRYVPKCDREQPTEKQTVFMLRTFTARQAAHIDNYNASVGEESQIVPTIGSLRYETVAHGVAGWEGLVDRAGNEVKPSITRRGGFECLNEVSMNRIQSVIGELFVIIRDINRLDEEEEGNSVSSAASSEGTSQPSAR